MSLLGWVLLFIVGVVVTSIVVCFCLDAIQATWALLTDSTRPFWLRGARAIALLLAALGIGSTIAMPFYFGLAAILSGLPLFVAAIVVELLLQIAIRLDRIAAKIDQKQP